MLRSKGGDADPGIRRAKTKGIQAQTQQCRLDDALKTIIPFA